MYEYHAMLIKVVDGDTMHVVVELGMDVRMTATLRILGVNAPELSTAEGKQSKLWAIKWFETHTQVVEGYCIVNTVKDRTEKYGRYLAKVTSYDGHVFNDDILAAGMAVPYMVTEKR